MRKWQKGGAILLSAVMAASSLQIGSITGYAVEPAAEVLTEEYTDTSEVLEDGTEQDTRCSE